MDPAKEREKMPERCPHCGSFVSKEATTCKRCGEALAISSPPKPSPAPTKTRTDKSKPTRKATYSSPKNDSSQSEKPSQRKSKTQKNTPILKRNEAGSEKKRFSLMSAKQAQNAYPCLAKALARYISAYKKTLLACGKHEKTLEKYREHHAGAKGLISPKKICIGIFQVRKKDSTDSNNPESNNEALISIELEEKEFAIVYAHDDPDSSLDLPKASQHTQYAPEQDISHRMGFRSDIENLKTEELLRLLASTLSYDGIPDTNLEYTQWGEDAASKKFLEKFRAELRTDACHSLSLSLFFFGVLPLLFLAWVQGVLSLLAAYITALAVFVILPTVLRATLPQSMRFASEEGIVPREKPK